MSEGLHIRSLASGGLIANYFCSSRCRHCLYGCGPEWPKDYITAAQCEANLGQVRRLGCGSVHIGGGEPLLRPAALVEVLKTAARCGVTIDYLETNASWYQEHAQAVRVLGELAAAGLGTLMVSVSPFHNEYIALAKTKGVIRACRDVGLGLFQWIPAFLPDLEALPEDRPHALAEYEARFGADYLDRLAVRYGLTLRGRPLKTYAARHVRQPLKAVLAAGSGGCRELADTHHFHVDLYGGCIPGLCAGLSIAVSDLGTPLAVERYPLLTRLYAEGVAGLLEQARRQHGFVPAADYASKCDLCQAIRTWIAQQAPGRYRELAPAPFYACV